jgi:hypothetical protein
MTARRIRKKAQQTPAMIPDMYSRDIFGAKAPKKVILQLLNYFGSTYIMFY